MKKICLSFLFAFILCCQNSEKHSYTFYYWRTNLSLNTTEKETLNKTNTPYLYTRFFDIEKVNGKFQPIAVVTKDETFKTEKEIVPIVFIKNDVFYDITSEEIRFLANNVFSLIQKKQKDFGFKIAHEIQIDCDWTAGTNKEYFTFLTKLKEISGKQITCTLRLHQVKNSKLSGIPPVRKVYLMCYSTSSPLEKSSRNSILDVPTLKDYLKSVNKYPIKIDVALPIYSWGIITNQLGKHKLINALSAKDLENPNFKKIGQDKVQVLKDGFYFGNYLNKGFTLKVEAITDDQLNEVKAFLDKKLSDYAIVYYHLDGKFVSDHKF